MGIPPHFMPKKPSEQEAEATPVVETVEKLFPFSVVIDGQDRTIFAKDQKDLEARIARLKSA